MDNGKLKHLIIKRLIECYQRKPAAVAKALDEEIDRSGNLLGWLRELSNFYSEDRPKTRASCQPYQQVSDGK